MKDEAKSAPLSETIEQAHETWQAKPKFHAPNANDEDLRDSPAPKAKQPSTERRDGRLSRLLTPASLASLLQTSEEWIQEEVEARRIPHLRLGGEARFDRRSIDTWLARQEIPAEEVQARADP